MADEQFIEAKTDPRADALADRYVDLAHPRLGTQVVAVSDDFFAAKERLIDPERPVFIPGKFDDNGKWMDGWESRRKRTPGHDWCIVHLGCPGRIRAVDIDTSHFTGNFPPEASIEVCLAEGTPAEDADWQPLVERMTLAGDSHHVVEIEDDRVWSHLRLHIYPDGGVARLRVYGEIDKDWSAHDAAEVVDLAALLNGATAVAWNDAHFGSPSNMLAPGKGANMGDGWETARRRVPGNDWAVLRLGHPGTLSKVIVDTDFFKGNYPDRCSLQAALVENDDVNFEQASEGWAEILPEQKLSADSEHVFEAEILSHGPISHVRLNIFPDGGVSRLRLFGTIARDEG